MLTEAVLGQTMTSAHRAREAVQCSFYLEMCRISSPTDVAAHCTDLSAVDYEAWGVLYRIKIRDVDHLKQRPVEEWRHFSMIDRALRAVRW